MDDKLSFLYFLISGLNVWTPNLINQPIKIQSNYPKLLSQRIRKRYDKTLGTIHHVMPYMRNNYLK